MCSAITNTFDHSNRHRAGLGCVRFSVCLVAERCGVLGSLSLSALLSHNGDVCACVGQPRPNGAAVSRQCHHESKASSPAVLRGSPEPGMRSRRMKTFIFSYKTKRTAKMFRLRRAGAAFGRVSI